MKFFKNALIALLCVFLIGTAVDASRGWLHWDKIRTLVFDTVKLYDTDATNTLSLTWNEDDSADRVFNILVASGNRSLTLNEDFAIGDGANVSITAEDTVGSIVLDEQTLEIEGEGTATRLLKLINAADSARTLTYNADFTIGAGSAVTVTAEDAAGSIVLDEQTLEIEGEGTASQLLKIINAANSARTLTYNADFTIAAGSAVTLTAEDAAGSIVLDEQTLEVEGEGTASQLFKLINAENAARTLTFNEDLTIGDGNAGTITFTGASKTLSVEDTSVVNQDLTSDAAPTFAGLDLTGLTDSNIPYVGAGGLADSPITTDGTDIDYNAAGLDNAQFYGYKEIFITGIECTNGTSAPGTLDSITNSGGDANIRNFDGAADEDLRCNWEVPEDMDVADGLWFRVVGWVTNATAPANSEVISYQLAGNTIANSEVLDENKGTAQASSLTADATYVQYDRTKTAWSSAITLTGIAAGESAVLYFNRDADGVDTYVQDHGAEKIILRWTKETIKP